jgi:hypothetical protein
MAGSGPRRRPRAAARSNPLDLSNSSSDSAAQPARRQYRGSYGDGDDDGDDDGGDDGDGFDQAMLPVAAPGVVPGRHAAWMFSAGARGEGGGLLQALSLASGLSAPDGPWPVGGVVQPAAPAPAATPAAARAAALPAAGELAAGTGGVGGEPLLALPLPLQVAPPPQAVAPLLLGDGLGGAAGGAEQPAVVLEAAAAPDQGAPIVQAPAGGGYVQPAAAALAPLLGGGPAPALPVGAAGGPHPGGAAVAQPLPARSLEEITAEEMLSVVVQLAAGGARALPTEGLPWPAIYEPVAELLGLAAGSYTVKQLQRRIKEDPKVTVVEVDKIGGVRIYKLTYTP